MGSLIPKKDLKDWLETWVLKYESPKFIEKDPISIPHKYPRAVDKEFVGFMTALISWGRRKSILNSASKMFSYFGDQPVDELVDLKDEDIYDIYWSHRTFLNEDGSVELRGLRAVDSYSESSDTDGGGIDRDWKRKGTENSKGVIRQMGSAFKSMILRGNGN